MIDRLRIARPLIHPHTALSAHDRGGVDISGSFGQLAGRGAELDAARSPTLDPGSGSRNIVCLGPPPNDAGLLFQGCQVRLQNFDFSKSGVKVVQVKERAVRESATQVPAFFFTAVRRFWSKGWQRSCLN